MNDSTLLVVTPERSRPGLPAGRTEDTTPDDQVGARFPAPVQVRRAPVRSQRGMVSAEWAVGIIAAIAIAGVLLGVVTSGQVKAAILKFILQVISTFSKHMGAI